MSKKDTKIIALLLSLCISLSFMAPCTFAEETTFATREETVSEFVQSVGRGTLEKSNAVLAMFSDADKISEEYQDDISRALVAGILKGYEDHTIRPDEPVKRIEAMVMLSRCVPSLEETEEEIVFSDVPQWAQEDISYLTQAGLLKGYGDGTMGSDDYITIEQVSLLTQRCDDALRTVSPGDSFYGYVNEKDFRNAIVENKTEIDPIHGAIITKENSWSYFNDIYDDIIYEEVEILTKLANGELEYEKGSVEQRIYDMLECIDSDVSVSENDKKNIKDMRNAILSAKTTDELLQITEEIYKLTGINVLFDIGISLDKETGISYPTFSIAAIGAGGFMALRKDTNTPEYKKYYQQLLSGYLDSIDADFSDKDVANAVEVQAKSSMDGNYATVIMMLLSLAESSGTMTEEELQAAIQEIKDAYPEYYNEAAGAFVDPVSTYITLPKKDIDLAFTGFNVCEELTSYGFTNLEKIIAPTGKVAAAEKNLISNENLNALKINALLVLNEKLNVKINDEEKLASRKLDLFPSMICIIPSLEEVIQTCDSVTLEDVYQLETPIKTEDGLINDANINSIRSLMPLDIGLLYAKHYYDDEISEVIGDMFQDIWSAYEARFKGNTWMKEETKKNAIKKLDNMLAVVAYPDNYTFPEITPISEGGTLFSNTLSIRRQNLKDIIRCNEDKEFIRTQMLLPLDMVNACYIPEMNTINVPVGILNAPLYDKDASYAANLGGIGMVIAHEVGHAFDKSGSQYDENGCLKNWWTEEDSAEFAEIQDYFVEYYNRFEVVDGVVQDASITITENMADFAAMQIIMDIIGDDQEAQKECFESYARIWAQLGTVSKLTSSTYMLDVHSSNGVRVNAVVSSFQQFYDIYGIDEDDAMYIAPEDRLKLW